jgi:hypothetical protein
MMQTYRDKLDSKLRKYVLPEGFKFWDRGHGIVFEMRTDDGMFAGTYCSYLEYAGEERVYCFLVTDENLEQEINEAVDKLKEVIENEPK